MCLRGKAICLNPALQREAAEPCRSHDDARELIAAVLNDVEDRYSGLPNLEDQSNSAERMYASSRPI